MHSLPHHQQQQQPRPGTLQHPLKLYRAGQQPQADFAEQLAIEHPWAHPRHRHHHSLDCSSTLPDHHLVNSQILSANQQLLATPNTTAKLAKRSLSLSSQSANTLTTHPSPSSPITYNNHPPQSLAATQSTINHLYPQPPQPSQKPAKPISKLPPVSAVPASVLKKDKPGLLSQEQKRANHIASEQKRRAAIRQGYSRLCLIVPALRAPVGGGAGGVGRTALLENGGGSHAPSVVSRRSEEDSPLEEEPSLDQPSAQNNPNPEESAGAAAFKRKRNKPLEANRAGTRSEAVVLAKTVEYLRELEVERKLFIEKLKRLKALARSKGIPIHTQKSTPHEHADTAEDRYHRAGEKAEEGDEGELPVWECKWAGNIQEIDRQFEAQLSAITDPNHPNLNLLLGPNLSPPAPFDLASSQQDQHPHLFHPHQNNNTSNQPQHHQNQLIKP